ncbi:MAG: hypothetical protein OHK005_05570 [Candidatus Methylacidiphilales bacterium]
MATSPFTSPFGGSGPADSIALLKREFAAYLAQHLDLELFTGQNRSRLRLRALELFDQRLHERKLNLDDETKTRLIKEIIDGIPTAPDAGVGLLEEENSQTNLEEIYKDCLSFIAGRLDDALFQPGQETRLAATVLDGVQDRLDALGITDEVSRRHVIERILHRLNPKLLELLSDPEPDPATQVLAEGELTHTQVMAANPIGRLTRDVLFYLATSIDPAFFELGDEKALRRELARLIDLWPETERRPIPHDLRREIIDDIIAKGTIEFQL